MTRDISENISAFKKEIWKYYKKNARDLPWRNTTDPYHILVSEVMLQQTQVSRVLKKYEEFLKKFKTAKSLAQASVPDLLTVWQGLGYNRRALNLKKACEHVVKYNKGKFPSDSASLMNLPGIGQSTAGALQAFSFNLPSVFIETNIRAVFLYFFFKEKSSVPDKDILELVELTVDQKRPREWYYALYDYGSMLKAKLGKKKTDIHKQSKHYLKQSKFEGSNRQVRSHILKAFLKLNQPVKTPGSVSVSGKIPAKNLVKISDMQKIDPLLKAQPESEILKNLESMAKEGFLIKKGRKWQLA